MNPKYSLILLLCAGVLHSQTTIIRREPVHLRSGEQREWRSFPERAESSSLTVRFQSKQNQQEYTLILHQRDVKAVWNVAINGSTLGTLIQDERDMVRILPIPAGVLRDGENQLEVSFKPAAFSDDIELSDIQLQAIPASALQRQSTIDIAVTAQGEAIPSRITLVDDNGFLVPVISLRTAAREAIRTGVVYTPDGKASINLPAGKYRVYASRGFEYSAPYKTVTLSSGEREEVSLRIVKELDLKGYASVDTHIHTLELSGHGDASVDERALTAAGEGLDVIVATEHNRLANYSTALRKLGLDRWVASIPGSEVTTSIGHFNVFPLRPETSLPNPKETEWTRLMESIKGSGATVMIQNHPRDLHSAYRPFDPGHHLSVIGENLQGRPVFANAMEVLNSGALTSDPLQPVRDWLGLLTRGLSVAAIGASDTHTVDFVPIGQARTYIDVSTTPDWKTNLDALSSALAEGRNMVSYGLAVDLQPAGNPIEGKAAVTVKVWVPSWSAADEVTIFSNGVPVWKSRVQKKRTSFNIRVNVPVGKQDAALVAVATGPAVKLPFWEVRKPYQPTSLDWNPIVLGVSRAIWIDGDGNGVKDSPLDYARRLVSNQKQQADAVVRQLGAYDSAVTMHALHLLQTTGQDVRSEAIRSAFLSAPSAVVSGYTNYTNVLPK